MAQQILLLISLSTTDSAIKEIVQEYRQLLANPTSNHLTNDGHTNYALHSNNEFTAIFYDMLTLTKFIFYIEEMNLREASIKTAHYIIRQYQKDDQLPPHNHEHEHEELIAARKQMNHLKKTKHRFQFSTYTSEITNVLNQSFYLLASILKSWKPKDWTLVNTFLKYNDYKIVAQKLQKDKSLMWRRKNSLKIQEYLYVKEIIIYITKGIVQ